MRRSHVLLLTLAAARAEAQREPKEIVKALQAAAESRAKAQAEGRNHSAEDEKRVERQRTMFAMVGDSHAKSVLLKAMLQQAYDHMWNAETAAVDALTEWLPSDDVDRMFRAWGNDIDPKNPRSIFYGEK